MSESSARVLVIASCLRLLPVLVTCYRCRQRTHQLPCRGEAASVIPSCSEEETGLVAADHHHHHGFIYGADLFSKLTELFNYPL